MTTLSTVFREKHKPFVAATTAHDYEIQLRHFDRFFGEWLASQEERPRPVSLADLEARGLELIQGAIAWQIGRGRSKDTADKIRRAVVAVWNRAAELKLCSPTPKVKREHRATERVPTAWNMDQFGRILWSASQLPGRIGPHSLSDWMTGLLWLEYNTGWRIWATLQTERTWCDLSTGVVRIEPEVQKDDEGMLVTLLPETIAALRPLMIKRPGGPSKIFGDWPWVDENQRVLRRILRTCLVDAGLFDSADEVTRRDLWHKIRRTFATQIFISTGGNIEEVRRMLGHSSPEVTWRYIDLSQVNRKSQADLLPRPKVTRLRFVDGE